jgi:imidazolonepropionase
MSPQEVLMGVTTIAAKAIGLKGKIGSLKQGYQADITLIDAPNLNHWLYHFKDNACKAVLKNGEWAYQKGGGSNLLVFGDNCTDGVESAQRTKK